MSSVFHRWRARFSKNPSTRVMVPLAAVLLMGLARILLLPPFEAPDETAHYSRIEASAFAKPGAETTYLSTDVVDYTAHGPMSAHWIDTQVFNAAYGASLATGQPPKFKEEAARQHYTDYRAFFGNAAREKDYARRYRDDPAPSVFQPSKMENGEYQHPPLYYVMMASLLELMASAPLIPRLLALRVVSYLLAFTGFALGLFALQRHLEKKEIVALGAMYPFFMPAFFVDFARLGNDGLCLLLFGLMWLLALSYVKEPRNRRVWALLGVIMGLALLTKAFMIVIGAGLLLFMLAYAVDEKKTKGDFFRYAAPAAVAGAIAILIGLWPYLPGEGQRGSGEFSNWLQGRGFMGAGIPWRDVMLNLRFMLTSTVYNFTDSDLTAFRGISVVALLPFVAIIAAALWAKSLPRDRRRWEWLPVYTLAPLGAGLFVHGIFAAIAYHAAGVTPGYYVHVEAPALALILGAGLWRWWDSGADRRAMAALFALAGVTNAAIVLGRLALFTGCLWETDDRLNIDWGHDACRPGVIYDRLALMAWPAAGLTCLALSIALFATAATLFLRQPAKD